MSLALYKTVFESVMSHEQSAVESSTVMVQRRRSSVVRILPDYIVGPPNLRVLLTVNHVAAELLRLVLTTVPFDFTGELLMDRISADLRPVLDLTERYVDLPTDLLVRCSLEGDMLSDHQCHSSAEGWRVRSLNLDRRQTVSASCSLLSDHSDRTSVKKSSVDYVNLCLDHPRKDDDAADALNRSRGSERGAVEVSALNDPVADSCEPSANLAKVDLPAESGGCRSSHRYENLSDLCDTAQNKPAGGKNQQIRLCSCDAADIPHAASAASVAMTTTDTVDVLEQRTT